MSDTQWHYVEDELPSINGEPYEGRVQAAIYAPGRTKDYCAVIFAWHLEDGWRDKSDNTENEDWRVYAWAWLTEPPPLRKRKEQDAGPDHLRG